MPRLQLPDVTLCAATSVNVVATIAALQASRAQADFAQCLLFTDAADCPVGDGIEIVPIGKLSSGRAYSEFVLRDLLRFIRTQHVLLVQWDGFVIDAAQWDPSFLSYDYIGAPWPQFRDGHDVGNGGFSLRSRKLLDACRSADFHVSHPEDVAICRLNRAYLEREHGTRFADFATAERFSFERTTPAEATFGFHGIFNMIPVLGPDAFWEQYLRLDDKSTAFVDYPLLMRQLGSGPASIRRRYRLTMDRIAALF